MKYKYRIEIVRQVNNSLLKVQTHSFEHFQNMASAIDKFRREKNIRKVTALIVLDEWETTGIV